MIEPRRRKPKTPLAAWIVSSRKRQPTPDGRGWTSDELAARVGVSDSTVRGWESGRSVKAENVEELERLFGEQAPGHGDEPETDMAALVAALTEQTAAMDRLVGALDRHVEATAHHEALAGEHTESLRRRFDDQASALVDLVALLRTPPPIAASGTGAAPSPPHTSRTREASE